MRMRSLGSLALSTLILAAAAAGDPTTQDTTTTDRAEPLPADLAGVGINEKLGAQVPLDLPFVDANGDSVTLARYCDGSRPIVLNLLYFGCPMLCGLIDNGLTDALKQIKPTAGGEFGVLSVSFDPRDTPTVATVKRDHYLQAYGRPGAGQGWHWLTGSKQSIQALCDAVGYGYRWNEARNEFAHAAALVILTPDGKVSRYLYGVVFDPRTLQLSLVEAADGKTASTVDKVLLFCFHYDAAKGRYGLAAANLMKAGGAVTVLVLAVGILLLRRREHGQAASHARG